MASLNRFIPILVLITLCSGCAHQVDIAPNLAVLTDMSTSPKIDKAVGYYIPEEKRALSVTTPAGGGDSVKYTPYADLEPGLNLVLSNVFTATYKVEDINDQTFLQSKNIAWIFTPTITTASSSRNAFFWPPTDFKVTINCIATDDAQQQVWNHTVQADNNLMAVKEILKDYGLAGRSAGENSLILFQNDLLASPVFR
jgi:hypothetical protein